MWELHASSGFLLSFPTFQRGSVPRNNFLKYSPCLMGHESMTYELKFFMNPLQIVLLFNRNGAVH